MQEELTLREQEIFDMLLGGSKPKEISYNLKITHDTIVFHQKNIYRKLGVNSIKELCNKYLPQNEEDKKKLLHSTLPTPFVLTFNANPPYGWIYRFDPDVFQYNGEYYPSPFKLGKENRLVEGDLYHITCFFTVNVDLEYIYMELNFEIDKITESIEDAQTSEIYKTLVLPVTQADLKEVTKKNGWLFDWKFEFTQSDRKVFKLVTINEPNIIHGLVYKE